MADATVKTVQYLDTRIEPQPDPVYEHVIAPTQNQYYRIPASGLSNSSINFNNLTTLGADRAYLDTFEIEITADISFYSDVDYNAATTAGSRPFPPPCDWTFDSFPFSKCCDEIRVNINGGAFFTQPSSYLRAKERYMKQYELSKCYENICPIHKPVCQTESGRNYNVKVARTDAVTAYNPNVEDDTSNAAFGIIGSAIPTRLGRGMFNYMQSSEGMIGGFNNSILRSGRTGAANESDNCPAVTVSKADSPANKKKTTYTVVWREPVCCSPFSSRYDATYGRPLYNITSMDLAFIMTTLKPMIRYSNFTGAIESVTGNPEVASESEHVTDYSIDIRSARLCYQVMTIPPVMTKPLTTLVPYRRFVPYITNYSGNNTLSGVQTIPPDGAVGLHMSSGVYTLNEIPTAIWMFIGPTKRMLQQDPEDQYIAPAITGDEPVSQLKNNIENVHYHPSWDSNRMFAYIRGVNLTLANTTQILATAYQEDLYRIAKANGCQDSFVSWGGQDIIAPTNNGGIYGQTPMTGKKGALSFLYNGCGSVLRLKPGIDMIVPDQPLIPGANARNMVFQVQDVLFDVPPHSVKANEYALWILFEYVGVAAISPGQCEITMNPLGSGEIMEASPVMSGTTNDTDGVIETLDGMEARAKLTANGQGGSKIGQLIKNARNWVHNALPTINRIAKLVDETSEKAANIADGKNADGSGAPSCKRGRGGAAFGGKKIGYSDWL